MANTDFKISYANFLLKVILYMCALLCSYAFLYTFAMEIESDSFAINSNGICTISFNSA